MLAKRVEKLRTEYVDEYVVVDGECPELARFKGQTGQVRTINHSGRALVQFDGGSNRGWYDVSLDYLKVVDKPEPKAKALPKKCKSTAAASEPTVDKAMADKLTKAVQEEPKPQKLSPLEIARQDKAKKESDDSPS